MHAHSNKLYHRRAHFNHEIRVRRNPSATWAKEPRFSLSAFGGAGRGENSTSPGRALPPGTSAALSSPSPPREERAGERRPFSQFEVRGEEAVFPGFVAWPDTFSHAMKFRPPAISLCYFR